MTEPDLPPPSDEARTLPGTTPANTLFVFDDNVGKGAPLLIVRPDGSIVLPGPGGRNATDAEVGAALRRWALAHVEHRRERDPRPTPPPR